MLFGPGVIDETSAKAESAGFAADPASNVTLTTALADAHRLAAARGDKVVRVEGSSMLPYFGDGSVLVYDRYDIWQLDPTGVKPAVDVTDGVGRRNNIQFRLADTGGGRGGRGGRGGNPQSSAAKQIWVRPLWDGT